jgi:hypothetical protein
VTETWVDERGGGLSAEGCPDARLVPFLNGTEPRYAAACAGARAAPSGGGAPELAPDTKGAGPPQPAPRSEEQPRQHWWNRWFGGKR